MAEIDIRIQDIADMGVMELRKKMKRKMRQAWENTNPLRQKIKKAKDVRGNVRKEINLLNK